VRFRTPNTGPPDRLAHPGRRIVAVAISPSSSVQRARQELAGRLREIRLDAGLTARALSAAAGWHEAKTSRIESARQALSDADIQTWCQVCGAGRQAITAVITGGRRSGAGPKNQDHLARTALARALGRALRAIGYAIVRSNW